VQDLYGGADPAHRLDVRVVTELAWHGLFIRHLLRRPEPARSSTTSSPEFTIINCPSFKADPGEARLPHRNRDRAELRQEADPDRRHRICRREQEIGLHAAELPVARKGRHADALLGQPRANGNPVDTAVFFGLSGTGKTTLSADPERT
jgi:phosphoenolpyruvate carboxykinase (ATP)